MIVKNVNSTALRIHATNQLVNPGDTVEVPDDLGKQLCEQPANWSKATKKKSRKTSEED